MQLVQSFLSLKICDSIEAERKLTHWLTEMNCQLIAMVLARIDRLYQIYKVQGGVARRDL